MRFGATVERLETKLRKIAGNVTYNKADQDDLLQEGWIYLWENREKLENKTISYVLTGCYFCFVDHVKQGKSIDSKARDNLTVISLDYVSDEGQSSLVSTISSEADDAIDVLIAKDLEEQIRKRLNTKLKETFDLFLEGHTLSEIAKRLNLTHEAIRLQVKKIRRGAKEFFVENLDY